MAVEQNPRTGAWRVRTPNGTIYRTVATKKEAEALEDELFNADTWKRAGGSMQPPPEKKRGPGRPRKHPKSAA